MLIYHCDCKGCDFTTIDKNELTHITIGDPAKSALSAELAEKDFCPNCVKRFTEHILSQTVNHDYGAPVKTQRRTLNDFEIGIATFAASCAERWKKICYSGDTDRVAKAYLEYMYGNQEDKYLLSKYHIIPPKVWSQLSSDVQHACKEIVAELLNYYAKTKSVVTVAACYDVRPKTVAGIISSNIVGNFPDGDLLCEMPVPSVKRVVLAVAEHKYTTFSNSATVKRYNVGENDFTHPTYAIKQKFNNLVAQVVDYYTEGKSVKDVATMCGCPVSLVRRILKSEVRSDQWHGDLI